MIFLQVLVFQSQEAGLVVYILLVQLVWIKVWEALQDLNQQRERRKSPQFITILLEENSMKLNLKNSWQTRIKSINKIKSLKRCKKKTSIDILRGQSHQLSHRKGFCRSLVQRLTMTKVLLFPKTMMKSYY
jgi:hypothetical protein